LAVLRDAALRAAPQDEVRDFLANQLDASRADIYGDGGDRERQNINGLSIDDE
jgi:hypothetical protein